VRFLFCFTAFLSIGCGEMAAAAPQVLTSYIPYRLADTEGWRLIAGSGDAGASRFDRGKLLLDFTRGAASIGIAPPDCVLLGNVGKIRIRLRSASLAAHPLHLYLRTHFMTFHKTAAIPSSEGEQEIVFDGPPGPGWQWMQGENDGRIHGPIRIGQIQFDANGHNDRAEVEFLGITVEGSQPANHLCAMTAHTAVPDTTLQFVGELRCMGATPAAGELSWTFRDWNGNELGRGRQSVTVPPRAEPLTVPVAAKFDAAKLKFVESEFQIAIPDQEIPQAHAYWTADQPRHTDSELRPSSAFGMGVYLDRYHGPDLERAASVARDAGVKWSREGFSWGRIEPQRGHFDWAYYDNLVATAKRYGISLYGLFSGWAPWTKPYTPEGIDDYLAFLKQLVRHYHDDIHHWEIWNEPNIFFWQGPREMYAELLRRSYAAVKETDPEAQVLGMSTSGIDYNFIARTMSLDAPFDILTIHPYRKVLNDRALINELRIVGDLVKGRPVWITEFGWTTLTPHNTISQDFAPFTERQQAELLARAYLCTLAAGIRTNTSWYDFRNDGDDPLYFENEMGILHRGFSPKPAYWTYSTLTRLLEGRHMTGAVDAGDGVLAYRFEGQGTVLALWSPERDCVATPPIAGKRATLVNAIGESRPLEPGTNKVELRAGAPVYLVLE
jgi:hypothetical protein